MPNTKQNLPSDTASLRREALSRWDNEGGTTAKDPAEGRQLDRERREDPPLTNAELVLLRIRVIALENLVIALLANASDRQTDLAREIAAQITPRAGYTQHPLTVKAADHMTDLVDRAAKFSFLSTE